METCTWKYTSSFGKETNLLMNNGMKTRETRGLNYFRLDPESLAEKLLILGN